MKVAVLILTFLLFVGCSKRDESLGEYIDNSILTTRVKSVLVSHQSLSGLLINVKSYKNRVMLSGFVNSYTQKSKAVEIASKVDGVEMVIDKLEVK